jgi:hypothetical protein
LVACSLYMTAPRPIRRAWKNRVQPGEGGAYIIGARRTPSGF